MQFTEVRVCRLLLYFLDRQDLGALILEESLAMLLHYSSGYARQCSAMLSEVLYFLFFCVISPSLPRRVLLSVFYREGSICRFSKKIPLQLQVSFKFERKLKLSLRIAQF